MLSREEAIHFITDVLRIPRPLESKQESPHVFLNQLILAFHQTIPFQGMSLMSLKPEDRHKPTLEEIKQSVTSGLGGLCYTLNTFMKFLLQALGYDVYFVISHIGVPNNHIVTVVQNLTVPGDRHLVDVGVGYPTYEAIPLNFECESPVYMHSFLQYKFVREGDTIVRWHGKGESSPDVPTVSGWRKICIIDPTPRELEYFDDHMHLVYSDPTCKKSPFHTSLRATIFRDQRATCIKDMSLLLEDDNHTLKEIKFTDKNALLETITQHFPQLQSLAIKALQTFTCIAQQQTQ